MEATNSNQMLKAGYLYKATTNSDLVVHRMVHLFDDGKFHTYHDYEKDKTNKKSWYLDRSCELHPTNAFDITQQKKTERLRGTWTLTATMAGTGRPLQLYLFSILWPSSWINTGYSSFTIGLESLEEAQAWHAAVSTSIENLRQDRKKTVDSSSVVSDAGYQGASIHSHLRFSGSGYHPAAAETQQTASENPGHSSHAMMSSDANQTGVSTSHPAIQMATPISTTNAAAVASRQIQGLTGDSSDEEAVEATALTNKASKRRSLTERWVPYKQTNGVAVYHLEDISTSGEMGGEYLVSAAVRGPPSEVLDVLMNGSSNTTILGPASRVQVLDCQQDADISKTLLRLVLEAPGWAGRLCAPREMIVERMLKTEEGMHVVLFSSVDVDEESWTCNVSASGNSQVLSPKASNTQASNGGRALRSLYRAPVLGWVRGTYAIAPLENQTLESSSEALITCIIKVDLKGVCGDKSWFRPFADALGWTDAFLDRILMTVILIRDEVEHGRFSLKPLSLLKTSGLNAEGQEDQESTAAGHAGVTSISSLHQDSMAPNSNESSVHASANSALVNKRPSRFSRLYAVQRASVPMPGSESAAQHSASVLSEAIEAASKQREMETSTTGKQVELPHDVIGTIDEEGVVAGPQMIAVGPLDLDHIKTLCTLEPRFWSETHAPGKPCPFVVRGPTYLKDRKKVPAGFSVFTFGAMDVVTMPHVVEHIARYLPSIRESRAPFAFVINLVIPGVPLLGIVATFMTDLHPDILGTPPKHPMEEEHDWQPFDFVLHKFLSGDNATRNHMLKLIPHIADGSWVVRQSVGTTPVITGKALKTTYHLTKQYIEIDIDVSANNVAAYVTGLVRGATKSLVIDMGFVLEGTTPWELPECLLGTLRLNYLDLKFAKPLNLDREIPLKPANMQPISTATPVRRTMHSRNTSLSAKSS